MGERRYEMKDKWPYLLKYRCLKRKESKGKFDLKKSLRSFIECHKRMVMNRYEEHFLPQVTFLLIGRLNPSDSRYHLARVPVLTLDNMTYMHEDVEMVLGHQVKVPFLHHLDQKGNHAVIKHSRYTFKDGAKAVPADLMEDIC